MRNYSIGIDIGTSSVKAVIISDDYKVVSRSTVEYPTYHTESGQSEQDAEAWWKAAVRAIRLLTADSNDVNEGKIRVICVSSHAPVLLPVDKDGVPLRRAIIWMDKRASEKYRETINKIGIEKYKKITSARPESYYLLPRILWFKENESEKFNKTHRFLQINGYINYRLTGVMGIDENFATYTHCYDTSEKCWSREISGAAELSFEQLFPPVYKSNDIVGYVSGFASREIGLPAGIPVIAGSSDSYAASMAIGLCKAGDAAEITGTSTIVYVTHDKTLYETGPLLWKMSPTKSIPTLLLAPVNTTGASLDWYINNFCQEEKVQAQKKQISVYKIMDEFAEKATAGNGLLYFPYLEGERGPLWNSYSKGMFIGLTLKSGQAEMIRAIFEGTSFAVRHIFDSAKTLGMAINNINSCGGGSRSEIWLKIKASILNMPLSVLSSDADRASLGNAISGGVAVGIFDSIEETASKFLRIKKVVEPVKEWVGIYEQIYPVYLDMYKHLEKDLMHLETIIDKDHKS